MARRYVSRQSRGDEFGPYELSCCHHYYVVKSRTVQPRKDRQNLRRALSAMVVAGRKFWIRGLVSPRWSTNSRTEGSQTQDHVAIEGARLSADGCRKTEILDLGCELLVPVQFVYSSVSIALEDALFSGKAACVSTSLPFFCRQNWQLSTHFQSHHHSSSLLRSQISSRQSQTGTHHRQKLDEVLLLARLIHEVLLLARLSTASRPCTENYQNLDF